MKNISTMSDYAVDKMVRLEGTSFDRHSKLSDFDIKQIRKRIDNGEKISAVAKDYNVVPGTLTYRLMSNEERKVFNVERNLRNPQIGRKISPESIKERINYKRALLEVKEKNS